jgi:1,3-beta-glucan synthase subunit FKS1, domain-1
MLPLLVLFTTDQLAGIASMLCMLFRQKDVWSYPAFATPALPRLGARQAGPHLYGRDLPRPHSKVWFPARLHAQHGPCILCWGEAGSVCFVPEYQSFILKCANDHYRSPECHNNIEPGGPRDDTETSTSPHTTRATRSSTESSSEGSEIIGCDRVFFKTYYEKRSTALLLVNFNRACVIHISLYWFYTAFQLPQDQCSSPQAVPLSRHDHPHHGLRHPHRVHVHFHHLEKRLPPHHPLHLPSRHPLIDRRLSMDG